MPSRPRSFASVHRCRRRKFAEEARPYKSGKKAACRKRTGPAAFFFICLYVILFPVRLRSFLDNQISHPYNDVYVRDFRVHSAGDRRGAHHMKKVSIRMRMIFAFVIIYLAPLLLLGIPGALWIRKNAQTGILAALQASMADTAGQIGTSFIRMGNYVNQIANDAMIRGIMYMQDPAQLYKRYSAVDFNTFSYQLKMLVITNDAFDDLALCFPGKNFSFSQRGPYTMDQLFTYEFAVEGMAADAWQPLYGQSAQDSLLLPGVCMDTFGQKREGVLYLRNVRQSYHPQPLLSVLFFISQQRLQEAVRPLMQWENMTIAITDDQGAALFAAGSSEPGKNAVVLSAPFEQFPWTLEVSVSERELMRDTVATTNLIWAAFVAMAALGVLFAIHMASINYQPLARIFSLLSSKGALDVKYPTDRELDHVEQSILAIIDKEEDIQRDMDIHRDLLSYAALSRLLDGTLSATPDDCVQLFDTLRIPIPYPYFSIGILSQSSPQAVQAVISACGENMINAYPITQGDTQAFLFNHMQVDDLRGLQERGISLGACMGMSTPKKAVQEVPAAYREALTAVDHRPVRAKDSMVFFEDVSDAHTAFYYPIEAEVRLVNMLRAHDIAAAGEELARLLATNLNAGLSRRVLQQFMYNIEMTCQKQLMAGDGVMPEAFPDLPKDASMEEHQQRIARLFEAFATAGEQEAAGEQDIFYQNVMAYLEEHFKDPQLSLTAVAAYFQVTPAHLSRLIKKRTGIGYLDIINRKRIALAKEYLRQGAVSIRQLAISVGFDNDVTLRRLFKKYEGITPTQFKE